MSPTELQQIAEAVGRQGLDFPWYAYIAAVVIALISAYLVNYLMNKAAIRASNENFNTLNDQLKKTTRDTEEIKAALSGSAWLTQQQWAFREKYYVELLTQLHKLSVTLIDRAEYFIEPGSEHDMTVPDNPRYAELSRAGAAALQATREVLGPASIFLSDAAIQSLNELVIEHWSAAYESHEAEYVEKAQELVAKAKDAVLAEAKKELAHWKAAGPSTGD